MSKQPQSRHWLVTNNNPEWTLAKTAEHLQRSGVKYTMQMEKGQSGTRHLQAYLLFRTKRRLGYVKSLLGDRIHAEVARHPAQAELYCRKEETRIEGPKTNFTEEEKASIGQGKRSEIAEACNLIIAGTPIKEVALQFPTSYVRYHGGFHRLDQMLRVGRVSAPTVLWLYGPTGTGKSRLARDLCSQYSEHADSLFTKCGSSKWFCGYDRQQCVIWDEFDDNFQLEVLLQLLDRYPVKLECKGGYVNFTAELIIITTNLSPFEHYMQKKECQIKALLRRINLILQIEGPIYSDLT